MSPQIVEITRSEEFSASHRLHDERLSDEENERLYGICNNRHGHGHNYLLEVTVRGEVPPSGMVMNLNDLMSILQEKILLRVDHKHLNEDVPFLKGQVTTSENIAIAFWGELAPEIGRFEGCTLYRVRICESRANSVDYYGPAR